MSLYGSSLFIEKSRQSLGVTKFLASNAMQMMRACALFPLGARQNGNEKYARVFVFSQPATINDNT